VSLTFFSEEELEDDFTELLLDLSEGSVFLLLEDLCPFVLLEDFLPLESVAAQTHSSYLSLYSQTRKTSSGLK
jgi:hypothetical protein